MNNRQDPDYDSDEDSLFPSSASDSDVYDSMQNPEAEDMEVDPDPDYVEEEQYLYESDTLSYDTDEHPDSWREQVELDWDAFMAERDYLVDRGNLDEQSLHGPVVGRYGRACPPFAGRYRSSLHDTINGSQEVDNFRMLAFIFLVETHHLVTPQSSHLPFHSCEHVISPEHVMPIDAIPIVPDGKDNSIPFGEFCNQYRGQLLKRILESRLSDQRVPTIDFIKQSLDFCMRPRFQGYSIDALMDVNVSLDGMILTDDDTLQAGEKIPLVYAMRSFYPEGSMSSRDRAAISLSDGSGLGQPMQTECPTLTELFRQDQLFTMAERAYEYLQTEVQAKFFQHFPDHRPIVVDFVLSLRNIVYDDEGNEHRVIPDFTTAFFKAGMLSLRTLLVWGKLDEALDLMMRIEEIWAFRDCPRRRVDGPWYLQYESKSERLEAFKLFILKIYNFAALKFSLVTQPTGGEVITPHEFESIADLLFSEDPRSSRTDVLQVNGRITDLGKKILRIRSSGGLRTTFRPVFHEPGHIGGDILYVPMQCEPGSLRWSPWLPGMHGHALNSYGNVRLMTYQTNDRGGGSWTSQISHQSDDDANPQYFQTHDGFESIRLQPFIEIWSRLSRALPRIPIANSQYFGLIHEGVNGNDEFQGYLLRNRSRYPFGMDLETLLDY